MRTIVNYIRQIFCKHDFEIEEGYVDATWKRGEKVYLRCEKCAYHTKHWKFL